MNFSITRIIMLSAYISLPSRFVFCIPFLLLRIQNDSVLSVKASSLIELCFWCKRWSISILNKPVNQPLQCFQNEWWKAYYGFRNSLNLNQSNLPYVSRQSSISRIKATMLIFQAIGIWPKTCYPWEPCLAIILLGQVHFVAGLDTPLLHLKTYRDWTFW